MKDAPDKIWLIHMNSLDEFNWVWCDEPSPDDGVEEDDTVGYVRVDYHEAELRARDRIIEAHKNLSVTAYDCTRFPITVIINGENEFNEAVEALQNNKGKQNG